jgi:predicted  nucleic acid-binding Zn-ribbon protein
MGLSLAAELNSVPGPVHALDFKEQLALNDDQIGRLQQLLQDMREQARRIGADIIAREEQLDTLLKKQSDANAVSQMEALTLQIGQLNGRLRAAHLKAHLLTAQILSTAQIARYDQLRGYKTAAAQ